MTDLNLTPEQDQALELAIDDLFRSLNRMGRMHLAIVSSSSDMQALRLGAQNPDLFELDDRKETLRAALVSLAGFAAVAAGDIYRAVLLGEKPRIDFDRYGEGQADG
jgi:hypothetical protein